MKSSGRFIPTSRADMIERGWDELDILLVSGDAYVDHPSFGVPLLARLLEAEGFRVGIAAQPDWRTPAALTEMGRPRLFAAISAGAMDSMVNHYTAAKKRRNDDAYTPGGRAGVRPNRAVIAYAAAVKGAFRGLPVIIGGIEASLRRLAHYDYWDDTVRRSILADSKADLLLFGMAETALIEVARRTAAGETPSTIKGLRGTACWQKEPPEAAVILPSYEKVKEDLLQFAHAFVLAEAQSNPFCARPLAQQHGDRWLIVNPPSLPLDPAALDRIYALPFTRLPHPDYRETIPAFEQIRFSITTHRGCFGGCSFCSIGSHQGKFIQSRSIPSIMHEVDALTSMSSFKGTVSDVGGPSANMYGLSCGDSAQAQRCLRPSCLWPKVCPQLQTSDQAALRMLEEVGGHAAVKHLFVASGIRFDLLPKQKAYLDRLLGHHVSGLLKVAPESFSEETLKLMRKAGPKDFLSFLEYFRSESQRLGKRQSVVPYLMASHPGSTLNDMIDVALTLHRLRLKVEQVQEFTPTPGTLSTCIYHTGIDPLTGEKVHVPRSQDERQMQKALLLWHLPESEALVRKAFRLCRREGELRELFSGR